MARKFKSNEIINYLVVAVGTFLGHSVGGLFRMSMIGAVIGSVVGLYIASNFIR